MRPVRLELAGFTAFREPAVLDLADADLFALVGPTGAGKSSLIDAACLALYGTVPRLDRRAVEPVISSGRNEARVRFDFTVAGRPYTAARVVRRTKTGASTKEARLESGGDVLAGDADGVTKAVEELFGLSFDQFTKCVVLPQGLFARFLHDRRADRQELLVRLLDLGIYDRMRQAATARASAAEGRMALLDEQLAGLDATPEALAAADQRVAALTRLREELDAAQGELDALAAAEQRAREEASAASERAAALTALAVPDDVAALAATATQAEQAAAAADAAHAEAVAAADRAVAAVGQLAPRADLERLRDQHERRAGLAERLQKGAPVVEQVKAAEQEAATRVEAATAAVTHAEEALEALRRQHAAHDLAAHLEVGRACPVCEHPVSRPPQRDAPPGLDEAEQRLAASRHDRDRATTAASEAAQERALVEQTLAQDTAALAEVDAALDGAPDAAEVARQLDALTAAEATLASAREHERQAGAKARRAAAAAREAAVRRDGAWAAFDTARDRVAAAGPPPVDRSDLAGAWGALVTWAAAEAASQHDAAAQAQHRAEDAQGAHRQRSEALLGRCAEHGVRPRDQRPRDAVADALATATAEQARLASDLERAQTLRTERDAQQERGAIARSLAGHLAANRFEQWLLDEATARLADGASGVLRQLSAGRYSLAVDDQRNFAVVDHANADERRSARTLSGGETFLASLALALALAEQLAELASAGAPRLESIFLDEGFGSLDPDTLDVVAAAIEELGAAGRTVGLVTHVRELADRVPVRFEVRRGPAGSTVEKVVV